MSSTHQLHVLFVYAHGWKKLRESSFVWQIFRNRSTHSFSSTQLAVCTNSGRSFLTICKRGEGELLIIFGKHNTIQYKEYKREEFASDNPHYFLIKKLPINPDNKEEFE